MARVIDTSWDLGFLRPDKPSQYGKHFTITGIFTEIGLSMVASVADRSVQFYG